MSTHAIYSFLGIYGVVMKALFDPNRVNILKLMQKK